MAAAAISMLPAAAAENSNSGTEEKKVDYMPEIHGVLRARWEIDTQHGDQRFQIRNARVNVSGNVAPTIGYYIQTDFCDAGTIKILDAYARVGILKGLDLRAGQFRMPFGVETFRSPTNYFFSNRSFMGKQVMNYRAVGARIAYTLPVSLPLTIEAGAFNPGAISSHTPWNRTVAYAAKATMTLPATGIITSVSYASLRPEKLRANLIDAFMGWKNDSWFMAAEYMFENYCGGNIRSAHSYMAMADWHMPLKRSVFNQFSVQGRFDGMARHTALRSSEEGLTDANRLTAGVTLTYIYKIFRADLRLNYEHYLNNRGTEPARNLMSAEIVVKF
jgi:hypothetical protein